MPCAAVICAAGAGARMGQNKALCRIDSETFLESIVTVLKSIAAPPIDPIVVVTGAQADRVKEVHSHLDVVWAYNAQWQVTHMLESLVCGLQCIPPGTCVLQWPVDCIGVKSEDLLKLVMAETAPFAVLSYGGKPGHPMRISAEQADLLRTGQHPFRSLRDVFEKHPRLMVEASCSALMNCNDPQSLADFVARRRLL